MLNRDKGTPWHRTRHACVLAALYTMNGADPSIDAEDIAQDAVEAALRREAVVLKVAGDAPSIGPDALNDWNPKAYAVACARRMSVDVLRRKRSYEKALQAAADNWKVEQGLEDRIEVSDAQAAVIRALASVSPEDRAIFDMHVGGASFRAIEEATGTSRSEACRIFSRVRSRLLEACHAHA